MYAYHPTSLIISKTAKFREKSTLHIKCMFHFSLQLLLKTFFALINIHQVLLEMRAESHVSLHVKCFLKLYNLYENFNCPIFFNKIPQYQIS
jgi:hypothetical protein